MYDHAYHLHHLLFEFVFDLEIQPLMHPLLTDIYIHLCIYAFIHTYMHSLRPTYMCTLIHTSIQIYNVDLWGSNFETITTCGFLNKFSVQYCDLLLFSNQSQQDVVCHRDIVAGFQLRTPCWINYIPTWHCGYESPWTHANVTDTSK